MAWLSGSSGEEVRIESAKAGKGQGVLLPEKDGHGLELRLE
jgi:hypothetical protein